MYCLSRVGQTNFYIRCLIDIYLYDGHGYNETLKHLTKLKTTYKKHSILLLKYLDEHQQTTTRNAHAL